MADNITTVNSGTGALPNSVTIATRDAAGGGHWQQVDVGPAMASPLTPAQWALSVGTGANVSLSVPANATHCWLSVDTGGGAIRWCRDGSAISSTQGHYLAAGDSVELDNLSNVRLRGIGSTATVQVSYHRYI